MSTLKELVEEYTTLGPTEVDHLFRLAGDWQLIADLSFADLLLWVAVERHGEPGPADGGPLEFLCVGQVRPTTAPTAYQDDSVGRFLSGPEAAHLAIAHSQGRIWRELPRRVHGRSCPCDASPSAGGDRTGMKTLAFKSARAFRSWLAE